MLQLQLTFVAQVLSVQVQATNMVMKLDDGTGQVETRQWIEQGPNANIEQMKISQGCMYDHSERLAPPGLLTFFVRM